MIPSHEHGEMVSYQEQTAACFVNNKGRGTFEVSGLGLCFEQMRDVASVSRGAGLANKRAGPTRDLACLVSREHMVD